MIKFYIAGRYVNKDAISDFADRVRETNNKVVSTWTDEPYDPKVEMAEMTPTMLMLLSARDMDEVHHCHEMIFFSESDRFATARNGRHVEFGVALGLHKRINVIGPWENIFHYLPGVFHYATEEEFFASLHDRHEIEHGGFLVRHV